MTEQEKPKEYVVDSFERLLNIVNTENCSRLAIDVGQWLIHYACTLDGLRKEYPSECEGKLNTEIANASFRWVDDGKNDLLSVEITNSKTGEFSVHEFNKK